MKLALIPPCSQLIHSPLSSARTGYHLLLPQYGEDDVYREHYTRRRACGDFLILDNGAAEGVKITGDDLLLTAFQFMVNEVVVPDVLYDGEATIQKARGFFSLAQTATEFNYMGVAQGRDYSELMRCIDALASMRYISTIAIPRHVETTVGFGARARLVSHTTSAYKIPIHLLGTNPSRMQELEAYGDLYRDCNVRGIDTASPYYYAMQGQLLNNFDAHCKRSPSYYTDSIQDKRLLSNNISTMKEWVYGN